MEAVGDHAIIGDCRAAALVDREGAIDWLCWPRFDSPSLFGALLDDRAGHWRIAPVGAVRVERGYVGPTNVLRTRFLTPTGRLALYDLMPVASEAGKKSLLLPEHEILRIAACEAGEVEVAMSYAPRPGFGRDVPALRDGPLGVRFELGAGAVVLRCEPRCTLDGGTATTRFRLRAGEDTAFSLTLAHQWPGVLPPIGPNARQALERALRFWGDWSARCRYDGPAREAVLRSALALDLLVYAPSGAVVAAATTSLPEAAGGNRNWDYRYCWLRDASLTARALLGLGFVDEARAFVSWLLQSTRLTRPRLATLYDVHGNAPPRERPIAWLSGHRGARPVRVGNAAVEQLQLDVYGEVVDAASRFAGAGGAFDRTTASMLRGFGEQVCRTWRSPDEGMWEPRSGRRRHTHSTVLCWTALDRLAGLARSGRLTRLPVDRIESCREEIRREVETRAWNGELESYVAEFGGSEVDASLLLLPWYGFARADSERMRATHDRIVSELDAGNGLLFRRREDRDRGEGAFGACGFWRAEMLALGGRLDEAAELFERLCARSNDVGLFAEEADPASGAAIGNFPQAFTHVGLVNAALTLAERLRHGGPAEGPA